MSQRGRWIVLVGSVLAAVLFGRWLVQRAERERPLIEVIDNTAELQELLTRSQGSGDALSPMSPDEFVDREPWTRDTVRQFYPMVRYENAFLFDEELGYRRVAHRDFERRFEEHPKGGFRLRTNSLGLRDRELREEVDLRILFAGDSQTEGVCGIGESFVNLLERALSKRHPGRVIDAVNAGLGGTHPWYYLSTIEARADLSPDIHVAVFFGGNDFANVIALERYYRGRGPGVSRERAAAKYKAAFEAMPAGLGPVDLQQILYFLSNPEDVDYAAAAWSAITMQMSRECEEQGALFVPVYLPSPLSGQPEIYADERHLAAELMPEVFEMIDHQHVLADRWMEDLRARGVEAVDLRPNFLAAKERLFWSADFHLNLKGQALVAEALEDALAGKVAALLSESPSGGEAGVDSEGPK